MLRTTIAISAVLVAAGCDTDFLFGNHSDRKIDVGDGREGEGEGGVEGEGAGEGEGEGEGEGGDVNVKLCGGTMTVQSSDAIDMGGSRTRHSAVLLSDGRVLLAGGHDDSYVSVPSAQIFDPTTQTFSSTGAMAQARYDFALVALDDGRAVAFGGFNNDSDTPDDDGDLATSEIFDPSADAGVGAWTQGPAMPEARSGLSALAVGSDKVIVFGGQSNATSIPTEVLLFDGGDDSLTTTTGVIAEHGTAHTAVTLSDGRVLDVGGYYTGSLSDVDVIFDDGHAAPAQDIPGARRSACATNDDVGNTLVFGGYGSAAILADVESYDPVQNAWSSIGAMTEARYAAQAVTLGSCMALVCGGVDTTTCEGWDFAEKNAVAVVDDVGGEFSSSLTQLDATHALVAGGFVGDFDVSSTAHVISLVAE